MCAIGQVFPHVIHIAAVLPNAHLPSPLRTVSMTLRETSKHLLLQEITAKATIPIPSGLYQQRPRLLVSRCELWKILEKPDLINWSIPFWTCKCSKLKSFWFWYCYWSMGHRWNCDSMKPFFLSLLHFDVYENEMIRTNDDDIDDEDDDDNDDDDDAFDYSTSH